MKAKWKYYCFKEIGYLWKQKEELKQNPSTEYHLWILTKKEAQAIAKQNRTKININLNFKQMAKDEKKSKKDKEKGKKDKNKPAENAKPKAKPQTEGQRKFSGSIALTKLQHVIMNKKNSEGKKIECLVIPIDKNYIERGVDKDGKLTGALYLNVNVITKTEEDDFGQHGFIGQSVASKTWKEAKDKEKEKMGKLPILGNIKDFSFNSDTQRNDATGSAGAAIDDDDDLPF